MILSSCLFSAGVGCSDDSGNGGGDGDGDGDGDVGDGDLSAVGGTGPGVGGSSSGGSVGSGGANSAGGSPGVGGAQATCTQWARAGDCALDNAEICIDGQWVPQTAECDACEVMIGCDFGCCSTVSVFTMMADGNYTSVPNGVTETIFDYGEITVTYEFTAAGQIGVVQIPHGYELRTESIRVTIDEAETNTTTVGYEALVTLNDGASGCLYYIQNPTNLAYDGYLGVNDINDCWGPDYYGVGPFYPMDPNAIAGNIDSPSEQMDVRFVADGPGTYTVTIVAIYVVEY